MQKENGVKIQEEPPLQAKKHPRLPGAGGVAWDTFSLPGLGRDQPCGHTDFRLLPSRT